MPLNRFVLSLAFLAITASGCSLDRSGRAYACETYLMDDAALHTDGAIPGWCLDRLQDGSMTDADMLLDAGSEDGGDTGDAELADAGPTDADVDADTDAGNDSGPAELDAGPEDSGPPDAGPPDSGPPDAGSDAGPPEGCADGTVDQPYPGRTDIVGCDGAVTQCMAATLCDAGWHLCTWDEYQARGGATQAATTFRWIASSVRSGCSDLTADAPTNAICSSCVPLATATLTLQYACGSMTPTETVTCNVGVVADTNPIGNHIGLPGTPCSMARIMPAHMGNGATCCR